MSKNGQYRFLSLSGQADSRDRVDEAYIEAFQKGYSVIEIARVIGVKSAKYIHASLVKHSQIPRGRSGRPQPGVVPSGMESFLASRELSFAQWCAGWHLEQDSVKRDIEAKSGAAIAAIRRDFPSFFEQILGVRSGDFAKGLPFKSSKPEVTVSWDDNEDCFRAVIPEFGLTGYGATYVDALKAALSHHRNLIILQRLESLPSLESQEAIW